MGKRGIGQRVRVSVNLVLPGLSWSDLHAFADTDFICAIPAAHPEFREASVQELKQLIYAHLCHHVHK